MNGCERVSMHLLPSPPPPSLFPSAVYDIVMNLRLTQPPPLPKHVTTQMNNKRSCYQVEEEYHKRVHLLTLLHLPSVVAPPFSSLLVSSSLFSCLLVSSRLFSSLPPPPVLCCPVSFAWESTKGTLSILEEGRGEKESKGEARGWSDHTNGKGREGKGGEGRGREGKGGEGKGREGKGREHTMRWDGRSDFSEWLCTPVGRMSLPEKVWSPKIK